MTANSASTLLTGFETANKYEILDPNSNQMIYFATEETSCCFHYWCGAARPFVMHITDNNGAQLMTIKRPMKCRLGPCCSCASGCQEEITVECPPGNPIGTVHQDYGCCDLYLNLYDNFGTHILSVQRKGPCAHCMCSSFFCCFSQDIRIPIMTANGDQEIGAISRDFPGYAQELFTDADNYSLYFPRDLQVEVKAMLIGVAFMLDFMYFEKDDDN